MVPKAYGSISRPDRIAAGKGDDKEAIVVERRDNGTFLVEGRRSGFELE